MSNKQFISNLSATYADVRRLDAKKINLKGKNILEYIEESVPTITHSQDTRETITENDLWGQWVETKDDGTIVIHDDYLSNPNSEGAWNSEVKAVQDNKAYSEITTGSEGKFTGVVENSVIANIQTERIKDGSDMFRNTSLTSFNGDLSSLVNGDCMFYYNTSLESFSGDLSSLVNGFQMFSRTSLTSFNGDLSSLVDGFSMFYYTSLESFNADLSSLVNGFSMLRETSLESFNSNLSSLVNGSDMFRDTPLTSFIGDLSSLVNGSYMFAFTHLASFSSNPSGLPVNLNSLVEGNGMFRETYLTSFSGDLSSLVNGTSMFSSTSLELFSGDLSSLVGGFYMFDETSLTPQSIMYIVESIRNIKEEKAKYTSGEIPWVTYDSTTDKYSAPFGFTESGNYVYTCTYTTSIYSSEVGQLTLGIDVTNDSDTIEQQLQTFAEGCLCDSWEELKQEFVDKGWTVTFQYGGTDSSITLSEDEQFRGVPVYARLIEVSEEDKDKAEYCTEDGTKFYDIDWGHDVTDYDAYQYFGSLLEACGYFGVIPVKHLEEN